MIPVTRRATLTAVRSLPGRQLACNTFGTRTGDCGKNVIVAQYGRRGLQHTRGFSQTTPSWSSLNFVLQPKEKRDIVEREGENEDSPGRPEHAVISTFDLFSIGGPHSNPSSRVVSFPNAPPLCFQSVRAVRTPSGLCGLATYSSTI